MGLELQAIELESELEWAEEQGRRDDARALRRQLVNVQGKNFSTDNEVAYLERDLGVIVEVVL